MKYSIHFTDTTVTIRRGIIGVRSTTNPNLIGAYASLYALHGVRCLPDLWHNLANCQCEKRHETPVQNRDMTTLTAMPPTSPTHSRPAFGPTMQPRKQQRPFGLRAQSFEAVVYQSKNYTYR